MAENLSIETNEKDALPIFGWEQGGAKTPFTTESTNKTIYESVDLIQNQPYSNLETAKTSAELMLEDTTLGVIGRYRDIQEARKTTDEQGRPIDNPLLTREEANLKYSQYGVTFNHDIRQNEAELIAAKKIKEYALKERLSNAEGGFLSGASSLLGGFAGAMLDPINIGTAFIPVTKIMPALKGLEASGFMGKVALKGIDGMVMNSLVEPLPLWMANIDQRDYTMADSLFNITAGGVLGAGIGAFTEGVRALAQGEKFNADLAAAIDYANNNGLDNVVEFQKKNPTITTFAYDDLIELPTNKLLSTQEGDLITVKLNETGPLSDIVGYGKDIEAARTDLREKIGAVLDDDSIFSGYRIDDGIDNFYRALEQSGNLQNKNWLPKWLNSLQKKAANNGLSLEEYIARQTNNFTEFEKLLKRAEQSRTMQENFAKEASIKKFGELTVDELDEVIEQSAQLIDAYSALKDAFAANPKQKMSYDTFIGNLREKVNATKTTTTRAADLEKILAELKEKKSALQKQLDTGKVTTDSNNLTKQINDLEASIKANELELNDLRKLDVDNLKNYDEANLDLLETMRAKLTEDPRTFDDVREQLQKQIADESGKTWDTSDSILDKMSMDEVAIADDARIAGLLDEIEVATSDIKQAMKAKKITKDEIRALGIDENGQSVEMRRADKIIANMDEFSKAAEEYAACRHTEVI